MAEWMVGVKGIIEYPNTQILHAKGLQPSSGSIYDHRLLTGCEICMENSANKIRLTLKFA